MFVLVTFSAGTTPATTAARTCEPGRICQGRRGEPAFEPERPAFGLGTHRGQCPLQREIRCGQAEHRRNGGQHERFGEQLHHDPAPGGTEGPPHENLPLTRRGSSKHQQRDVAADHHEKQRAEGVDRMNARPDKKVLRDCNEGFGVRQHLRLQVLGTASGTAPRRGTQMSSTPPEPPGARCQSPDGRIRARTGPRPGSCGSSRTRSGVQRFCRTGNANPSGMTPTTVACVAPSRTTRPITAGSAPNRIFQRRFPRTTTAGDCGDSSSSTSTRPIRGGTPVTRKAAALISAASTGSPTCSPTIRFRWTNRNAPMSSRVRSPSRQVRTSYGLAGRAPDSARCQ